MAAERLGDSPRMTALADRLTDPAFLREATEACGARGFALLARFPQAMKDVDVLLQAEDDLAAAGVLGCVGGVIESAARGNFSDAATEIFALMFYAYYRALEDLAEERVVI